MNIEIKYFISNKWISSAGQTSASQTGPWYSLNGDKVLYLNNHLYMIRPIIDIDLEMISALEIIWLINRRTWWMSHLMGEIRQCQHNTIYLRCQKPLKFIKEIWLLKSAGVGHIISFWCQQVRSNSYNGIRKVKQNKKWYISCLYGRSIHMLNSWILKLTL